MIAEDLKQKLLTAFDRIPINKPADDRAFIEALIDDLVGLREALERLADNPDWRFSLIATKALTESRARMKALGVE